MYLENRKFLDYHSSNNDRHAYRAGVIAKIILKFAEENLNNSFKIIYIDISRIFLCISF